MAGTFPEQQGREHITSKVSTASIRESLLGYGLSILGVLGMTALIALVPNADHTANVSLLYLLIIVGAAHRFGQGPAVLASLLAVLTFDWFFVAPRYTLTVTDPAEWLALVVFLFTAIVTSQLTATLHRHAQEARNREQETTALAQASWAVASQVSHHRALSEVLRHLTDVVGSEAVAIFAPGQNGELEIVAAHGAAAISSQAMIENGPTLTAVESVLRDGGAIGWQSDTAYLPLALDNRVLGVLYLRLQKKQTLSVAERRVVEALCHHAAVSLERHRLALAETQSQAVAEADRLKTALLSMISHDFRSPLTSIKTSVTGLLQEGLPLDSEAERELLQGIDQETDRLNAMVGNVLALSRLEAGAWRPQCEMVPVAEVVGAALNSLSAEQNERIQLEVDEAVGEAWLDMVQIVQVLHNLLENALKYSPQCNPVQLAVTKRENQLLFEVADAGAGLLPGEEHLIFQRFYRAPRWRESSLPGTGIGLAVCCGLVEAHGGELSAGNRPEGGAVFRFTLPLASPQVGNDPI